MEGQCTEDPGSIKECTVVSKGINLGKANSAEGTDRNG